MSEIKLKENQAALILESSEDGEITVNVAAADQECLAANLCSIIATKLTQDSGFQNEILEEMQGDGETN